MNKKIILLFFLASSFLYGETLEAQIRSDFILADSALFPTIRLDGEGNIHAVWRKSNNVPGSDNSAYYAVFDSLGHPKLSPARVSIRNDVWDPRIALSNDHAVVVWTKRGNLDSDEIEANVIDLNNEVVPADIDFAFGNTYSPDVAYLNDTTFIVVWIGAISATESDFQLYGQIATNSMNNQGGNILLDDPAIGGVSQYPLRVIARPAQDDFLIVWLDDRSGSLRVYGRFFNLDGSPIDSIFLISEDTRLTEMFYLSAAVNESGKLGIVWGGTIGSMENVIQLSQIGADRIFTGPSIQVNSPEAAGEPSFLSQTAIAFDRDGTFVVEWIQIVDDRWKIYAQRFLPDDKPFGENLRISMTEDSLSQVTPNVLLRNGRIYSFWALLGGGRAKISANIIDFYGQTGVEDQSEPILPLAFSLHQNYPNPFNPVTRIEFALPEAGLTRLIIYDLRGREIAILVDGELRAGIHNLTWDASKAASGIYIYRLTSGSFVATKKMVLLK